MEASFNRDRQNKLTKKFHALHHATETLLLPNAWDCTSAKIFEQAGFAAIATTSSGISWSCGYQDGEHIPPELMLKVISRITHQVSIPVTADIEGGYYRDMDKFAHFINDLIEAGAVGINLEDIHSQNKILNDINHQAKEIALIKSIAKEKKVNLFVNARTDAMEKVPGDLESKIKACIERAEAFADAGADGIFVPFVKEIETVARLKEAIRSPLNILFTDTLPLSKLKQLKVDRISTGSRPILATLNLLKKAASEWRTGNDWSVFHNKDLTYPEINSFFK